MFNKSKLVIHILWRRWNTEDILHTYPEFRKQSLSLDENTCKETFVIQKLS